MTDMQEDRGDKQTDRREQGQADRRKGDRRQSTEPYTGPERRKYKRRQA